MSRFAYHGDVELRYGSPSHRAPTCLLFQRCGVQKLHVPSLGITYEPYKSKCEALEKRPLGDDFRHEVSSLAPARKRTPPTAMVSNITQHHRLRVVNAAQHVRNLKGAFFEHKLVSRERNEHSGLAVVGIGLGREKDDVRM